MRIANIAIYCEVVDLSERSEGWEGSRKAIFPIDVATSDGAPIPSKELARAISTAAEFMGLNPYEFVQAMIQQMQSESDKLRALYSAGLW